MSTPMPLTPLKIIGVTANCGNDTLGAETCKGLFRSMLPSDAPSVLVINCQEVHHSAQLAQLEHAIRSTSYRVIASNLMATRTKPTADVLLGRTGMATFVIYDTRRVKDAAFDVALATEVRGKNSNKGGYLNTLSLTTAADESYKIRTISGHLDSNSDASRASDWENLKRNNAFAASSWDELVSQVPDVQIAGYDANTRDIWTPETDSHRSNLWHQETPDSRIAPMVYAPLGTETYSRDNTYKTSRGAIVEDKKRRGLATAGALDYVAIQNNTRTEALPHAPHLVRYTESPIVFSEEDGTVRDHDVIGSPSVTLEKTPPFERVRHHIVSELLKAAPKLAKDISELADTEHNRTLLLALHQHYLSPQGKLVASIGADEKTASVPAWFADDTIDSFLKEQLHGSMDAVIAVFAPTRSILGRGKSYEQYNNNFRSAYDKYVKAPSAGTLTTLILAADLYRTVTTDKTKMAIVAQFKEALSLHESDSRDPRILMKAYRSLSARSDDTDSTDADSDRESESPHS